jgi:hypothetical protein
MLALTLGLIVWGATAWAASDDPCKSGPDDCSWTAMQWIAQGLMPLVVFALLVWFAVALVRAVLGIDNRRN